MAMAAVPGLFRLGKWREKSTTSWCIIRTEVEHGLGVVIAGAWAEDFSSLVFRSRISYIHFDVV